MKSYLILGLILGLVLLSSCQWMTPPPIPVTNNDSSAEETKTRVRVLSTLPKVYHIGSLGRNGFSPDSITIKPGDTMVWNNYDPEKRVMVIVFHNVDDRWKYINSPQIKPGERYQFEFTKTGEYEFWTTEYGVMGKIEVKEI